MAHIDCSFYSEALLKNVHVIAYLPTMSEDDMLEDRITDYYAAGKKFPVLYLLHGMFGSCLDWPLRTGIELYAQEKGVAVIMPSAENSYYMQMRHGENYLKFVAEELPEFMGKMFPLCEDREHTYIAGLSMGGYGAFRIGLAYPERFGRIAALSGALDPSVILTGDAAHVTHLPAAYKRALADNLAEFAGTDDDLLCLAKKLKESGAPVPKMFMTVGTEDFTLPLNEAFYAGMHGMGFDIVYEKHPGDHNWQFWDTYIRDVLNWL